MRFQIILYHLKPRHLIPQASGRIVELFDDKERHRDVDMEIQQKGEAPQPPPLFQSIGHPLLQEYRKSQASIKLIAQVGRL